MEGDEHRSSFLRRRNVFTVALCTLISIVSVTIPHLIAPSPISAPLLSSYIGGTVNFVLMCQRRGVDGDLMNMVAGVDCLVMGAYLARLETIGQRYMRLAGRQQIKKGAGREIPILKTLLLVPVVALLLRTSSAIANIGSIPQLLSTPLSLLPLCVLPPLIPLSPLPIVVKAMGLLFYTLIGFGTPVFTLLRHDPGPILRVGSVLALNYGLTSLLIRGRKGETLETLTISNALVGGSATATIMAAGWGLRNLAVLTGSCGYIFGCGLAEFWDIQITRLMIR